MYGVVLWSDSDRNCAVIWCEDHRNLAYFKNDPRAATTILDFGPGDLVEFEVREENDMRVAVKPNVVAQDHYPGLADELIRAGGDPQSKTGSDLGLPGRERDASHVLPFPDRADRAGQTDAEPTDAEPTDVGRKYG